MKAHRATQGSTPNGRVVIFAEFAGEMRAVEGFGHVEIHADTEYPNVEFLDAFARVRTRYSATVQLGDRIMIYAREAPPAPGAPAEFEQPPRQVGP